MLFYEYDVRKYFSIKQTQAELQGMCATFDPKADQSGELSGIAFGLEKVIKQADMEKELIRQTLMEGPRNPLPRRRRKKKPVVTVKEWS